MVSGASEVYGTHTSDEETGPRPDTTLRTHQKTLLSSDSVDHDEKPCLTIELFMFLLSFIGYDYQSVYSSLQYPFSCVMGHTYLSILSHVWTGFFRGLCL